MTTPAACNYIIKMSMEPPKKKLRQMCLDFTSNSKTSSSSLCASPLSVTSPDSALATAPSVTTTAPSVTTHVPSVTTTIPSVTNTAPSVTTPIIICVQLPLVTTTVHPVTSNVPPVTATPSATTTVRPITTLDISLLREPYHPPASFKFPKSVDGRSCQGKWFSKFSFLHYCVENDKVFCCKCCSCLGKKLIEERIVKEDSFFKGFRKWKKAIEKFREHERSEVHRKCASIMANLKQTPVTDRIVSQSLKEQCDNRIAFLEVIGIMRTLTRQGIALRGHYDDDGGNLIAFIKERALTVKELDSWMKRREKYLSHDIQNELIQVMAHAIQREQVKQIKAAPFLAVIADGTTDISGKEQFSVCVRFVNSSLVAQEIFLGLCEPPNTTGATLYSVIRDVFIRLSLDWDCLRAQGYDGASNMQGRINGCQAKVIESQPLAMPIHCANHSLDLALQEEAKNITIISNALNCIRDLATLLNSSSKRLNLLKRNMDENDSGFSRLLSICPTRWTVRNSAVARFLSMYDTVFATVEELSRDKGTAADAKAKMCGYSKYLTKFETVFAMQLCTLLFEPCERLAKSLQRTDITATEALSGAELLVKQIQRYRSDHEFDSLYRKTTDFASSLNMDINDPKPPRPVKPPRRLEHTQTPGLDVQFTAKGYLQKCYYEAVDCILNELERRFQNTGLKRVSQMEQVLISNSPLDETTVQAGLGDHSKDFDIPLLVAQLRTLSTLGIRSNVKSVADMLSSESETVRTMLSECVKLCQLILTVPVSVASSERSFSALRRIKSYLRSTMGQARLTHLMLLHVHRDDNMET